MFDQTELTTKGGRAFLHILGGAAGDEIADEYVTILKETNVKGYRYVKAAEGVETREQLAMLQEYGCPQGQGYYFSRPVPAVDFGHLLKHGERPAAFT